MYGSRVIVLKFGGSVLRSEATLRLAVHEIYRWRRDGYRVVAVVSALAGQTDELLRKSRRICASAAPAAVAALVSLGELQSAALLGLHLDRAGVAACTLTPTAIRLVAGGHPLDAKPVSVNDGVLRKALEKHGVVVVPGYVAQDHQGRTVVLGRGGSDLTALFLAHRLKPCVCRLVKDVDGLYDRDPANAGPAARRFGAATWEDALRSDGTIVQYKAVEFARDHELEFELGGLNATNPTRIGAGPTSFAAPDRVAALRVALLGLGTVGGGVYELLRQMPEAFEVVAAAVRNPTKEREPAAAPHLLATSALSAATCGADVVVEALGGDDPACATIEGALLSGAHVVTANKAVIADAGPRLRRLAETTGRALCYSAAVGGSMPLLEQIGQLAQRGVRRVRAVLNGTTNYVLEEVRGGVAFDEAVRGAQKLGFAEQDPTRDLNGQDAADKLCVIAQAAGARELLPDTVARDALTAESVATAIDAAARGAVVRHVATLDLTGPAPRAEVRLLALEADDPLADVAAEQNAAVVETGDDAQVVVRGRGAGRWPTAEAVIADLLEISRSVAASAGGRRTPAEQEPALARAG